VKEIDLRMLVTEAKALGFSWWHHFDEQPYIDLRIEPWTWEYARAEFLSTFDELKNTHHDTRI